MPRLPKVSIITPTLNAEKFILRNLCSVHLRQGHLCDIEQIIVDSESTDKTIKLVEEFKVKYSSNIQILKGKDDNMYDAINKGLRIMNGDIWANLNADDEYADGVIPLIVHEFLNNPEVDVVYGLPERIDHLGRRFFTHYFRNFDLAYLVWHGSVVNASLPATFFRRNVIDRVGLFNTNYKYASDYDYLIRVGKLCRLIKLSFVVTRFREHGMSSSVNPFSSFIQIQESLSISARYKSEIKSNKVHQMVKEIYMLLLQMNPCNFGYYKNKIMIMIKVEFYHCIRDLIKSLIKRSEC